jgi:hypothetical protein
MLLFVNIYMKFHKDYVYILIICYHIKLPTVNPSLSLFNSILKKTKHMTLIAAILLLVQGLASDGASVTLTSIARPSAMLLLAIVGD